MSFKSVVLKPAKPFILVKGSPQPCTDLLLDLSDKQLTEILEPSAAEASHQAVAQVQEVDVDDTDPFKQVRIRSSLQTKIFVSVV